MVRILLILILLIGCNKSVTNEYFIKPNVKIIDKKIVIEGTSNLPNKAQLLVSVYNTKTNKIIIQDLPFVNNGKFKSILIPKKLKKDKYLLKIEFYPDAFDWTGGEIKKILGEKGEKMKGKQVKKAANGVNILQSEIKFQYP